MLAASLLFERVNESRAVIRPRTKDEKIASEDLDWNFRLAVVAINRNILKKETLNRFWRDELHNSVVSEY